MILLPPSHHTTLSGMRDKWYCPQVKSFTRPQWRRGPRLWYSISRLGPESCPQRSPSVMPSQGWFPHLSTSWVHLRAQMRAGSDVRAGNHEGPKANLWDVLQGL